MLNPDIFSRHGKKTREQREQGEQPHEYRRISVPSAKNDGGTEIPASILIVPPVPSVPPKNISNVTQYAELPEIVLNPDIFCRHGKNPEEQREQGEQPHEYRRIPVPSTKNDKGTGGTDQENVPFVSLPKPNKKGVVPCSHARRLGTAVRILAVI